MDKEQIMKLLQAMYLDLSGFTEAEIIQKYEVEETFAKSGIKLCTYLRSIKSWEVKKWKLIFQETTPTRKTAARMTSAQY